jgi:hypothetical protein
VPAIATLRKSFKERRWRLPFNALPIIEEEGLVLGRGTVLARMGSAHSGVLELMLQADEARLLALLSAVYGRQVSPRVMHHVKRASDQWSRGDKALAHIELAFAQLPRLETEEDSFRLFLAEDLLDKGMTPQALTRALGFNAALLKFDPSQPRQSAGHGRESGEWIKVRDVEAVNTSARIAPRVIPFLERASPVVLRALATLALRNPYPIIIGGAILIPTPNSGGIYEGEVPSLPGVRYRLDDSAGVLTITANLGHDVISVKAERHPPDGLFIDSQGLKFGRSLKSGIYLDADSVVLALHDELDSDHSNDPRAGSNSDPKANADFFTRPDEPKLCPAPSPDQPGAGNTIFDLAYAEYADQEIVNPGYPTLPRGLAFSYWNPIKGKNVHIDGCQYATGDPQEYKGHYAQMLAKPFFAEFRLKEEFLRQAQDQTDANVAANIRNGRINTVQWRFDERETADFAWDLFRRAGLLGGGQIRVHYTPYEEHKDELYPDPED